MRIPFSVSFKLRFKHGAKKRVKKSTAVGLVSIVILSLTLPILGFILPNQSPVQAAGDWWNEDWTYRQSINLNSPTTQSNVYYQLQLDTSNTTKFNADCSDLRFVNQQGQQIPHHLVSGCGTSTTQVQLLFSTLPQGDQDLYLYYGNPQATTTNTSDPFNNPATGITTTLQPEQTSPAPVAHWKFDEGYGTTTNSSTSTNYPGTINGATWQQEDMCPSGKCLYFDGVDDRVSITHQNTLNLSTGDFTISVWIKVLSSERMRVINKWDQSAGIGWILDINAAGSSASPDSIRLRVAGSGDSRDISAHSTGIGNGQWHQISIIGSRGLNDGLVIFLDGKIVVTSTAFSSFADSLDNTATLGVGVIPSVGDHFFKGFIDEPKIYNYPRTQQQIQQDYLHGIQSMQAQQANLSNGLVGYWKMDEPSWNGTPGEIKDSSGNGLNGAAACNGNGCAIGSNGVGKFGNGGVFAGGAEYIAVPLNAAQAITSNYSFSMWFKADVLPGSQATIYRHLNKIDSALSVTSTGRLHATAYSAGASTWPDYDIYSSDNVITPGDWNYITVAVAGTRLRIYTNGQLNMQADIAATQEASSTYELTFSLFRDYQQLPLNGGIDEVRMYNRTLGAAEVSQLYTSAPKPVAYYDFEEGSGNTAYDKSGNNIHGAWAGTSTVRYGSGNSGKAGVLNGIDDRITLSSSKLIIKKGFTLAAWIHPTQNIGGHNIIANQSPWNYRLFQSDLGLRMQVSLDGGNGGYHTATNVLQANQWQYVVGTFDGSIIKMYVNGTEIYSASHVGQSVGATSSAVIGSCSVSCENFAGQLDEVKIYNYARTPAQILQDMQSSMPNELNPIGYWKFDENQGSLAKSSGQAGSVLDGTLTNMASPTTTDSGWAAGGVKSSGLNFDGDNDSVSIPSHQPIDNMTALSASAWIYPRSMGEVALSRIFNKSINTGAPQQGWLLGLSGNNGLQFYVDYSDTDLQKSTANNVFSLNTWSHIVVTWSGDRSPSSIRIYVNGKEIPQSNTVAGTGSRADDGAANLLIGNTQDASRTFDGLIDEPKVYNQVLTPQQIAIDYNQSSASLIGSSSTTPTISGSGQNTSQSSNSQDAKYCVPGSADYCAKPVGEWNFEEKDGTVKDASGNNNHGTLQDGASVGRGKHGSAADFSSSRYAATVPIASNLPTLLGGDGSFTAMTWVKRLTDIDYGEGQGAGVLGTRTTGGTGVNIISTGTGGSTIGKISQYYTLPLDKWMHVVMIYDSQQNTTTLFLDGQYKSTITASATFAQLGPSSGLSIGNNWWLNSGFPGLIDQVKLYNYVRTPAQVAWDYNQGKPMVHYKLDECSGLVARDSSDSSKSAAINFSLSPGSCNTPGSPWALGKAGKYNSSLYFNGVADNILEKTVTSAFAQSGSISAWINPDSTMLNPASYPKVAGFSGDPSIYIQRATGKPYIQLATSTGPRACVGASTIQPGQWQHLVGVYQQTGSDLKLNLYLNGKPACSITHLGTVAQSSNKVFIGSLFQGQIDDIQYFNYPLTNRQIDTLYNGGAVRWGL